MDVREEGKGEERRKYSWKKEVKVAEVERNKYLNQLRQDDFFSVYTTLHYPIYSS